MSVSPRSTSVVAVVCVALGAAASVNIGAARQAASATVDPIPALLAEVHALRLAMELSAVVNPRVQLTLARLTIQEQRTTQLGAQLEQVRRQLGDTVLESGRTARALEEIDARLPTETNEQTRKALEEQRMSLRMQRTDLAATEQQLRTRENDTAVMLAAEQNRWIDLNARLDELERLLGPVR